MPLPNLFIPGAAKSGTSSLHEYLHQHPYISMSKVKEPHFFCANTTNLEIEDYKKLFENNVYRGESSTGYMMFEGVVERIKKTCPNPKFIFLLRNPIDRLLSHYNWLYGQGAEFRPFVDAIKYDMDIKPKFGIKELGPGYKSYFQWGLYANDIDRYINAFETENILVLFTEELKLDPEGTMRKCTDFLNLEFHEFDLQKKINKSSNVKGKKVFSYLSFYRPSENSKILKYYRKVPAHLRVGVNQSRQFLSNKYRSYFSDLDLYDIKPNEREWLADLYKDDVKKLKSLIDNKIEVWEEFIDL